MKREDEIMWLSKSLNLRSLFLFALLLIPAGGFSQASVPQIIKVQGTLTDISDLPINGSVDMSFELFDAETGGLSINSAGPILVEVVKGIYDVTLPFTTADFDGSNRYLEITVDGDILSPRVRVVSVPYAYEADRVDGFEGAELDESAEIAAHEGDPDSHREHATLEESAEIATAISGHKGKPDPHSVYLKKAGDTMTGPLNLSPSVGDALIATTGNVGIGTVAPSERLEVVGLVKAVGFLGDDSQLTGISMGTADSVSNEADVTVTADSDANGTGAIKMRTGLADRLTVLNNGNVGIGTTTPTQPLDVAGNVNLGGNLFKGGSLFIHTNGGSSTAVGASALSLNTGSNNTANGTTALMANTTGSSNTASGSGALKDNTTGFSNTSSGAFALRDNTTGSSNTAVGSDSLMNNTTGFSNTASGRDALLLNTIGNGNTAIGVGALNANTTGSRNTAIGKDAGFLAMTGNDNIYVNNAGVAVESGTIRIGTTPTHTRAFIAGISGVTTGGGAVQVLVDSNGQLGTISSSRRFKEDIRDMGEASSGLMQLRPVMFRYKKEHVEEDRSLQYGLIAEEVAEVYPELVQYTEKGEAQTVLYHLLSTMLLNEVQKLEQRIEHQEKENQTLRQRLARLESSESVFTAVDRTEINTELKRLED